MTKEEWEKVEEAWPEQFSSTELLVDGYKVSIHTERYKMRLVNSVYVNGWLKMGWLCKEKETDDYPEEGKRFYQTKKKKIYSPKQIKEHEKIFGKRWCKKKGIYDAYISHKLSYWTSFIAFKRHLIANNKSIELVK